MQLEITQLLYSFVCLIILASAIAWAGLAYPLRIAPNASLRFVIANLTCLLAIMLTMQRTAEPSYWFWQVADLLLLTVLMLFRSGVQRLFRLPYSLRWDLVILAVTAFVLFIQEPSAQSQHFFGIIFSAVATYFCAMLTRDALLGIRPQINGQAGILLAIPPALLTLFFAARLFLLLLMDGPERNYLVDLNSSEGHHMLWFMVAQSLLMNVAMFAAALTKLVLRIKHLAERDILTGVANRRIGILRLEQAEKLYQRDQMAFCIVLMDLDYFKKINDTLGHVAGDAALKECAHRLSSALRGSDVLFRYGGEEFLVLLPMTELPGALEVAARLQHALSAKAWYWQDQELTLTASMGIASIKQANNLTSLIQMADQAMFQAKNAGRNCIMVHQVEMPLQIEN